MTFLPRIDHCPVCGHDFAAVEAEYIKHEHAPLLVRLARELHVPPRVEQREYPFS